MVWTSTKGPILNFADGEGRSLPSGCRVGQCESCALHSFALVAAAPSPE
jgi:ferredoxin